MVIYLNTVLKIGERNLIHILLFVILITCFRYQIKCIQKELYDLFSVDIYLYLDQQTWQIKPCNLSNVFSPRYTYTRILKLENKTKTMQLFN